ncbi:hypothetical protein F511_26681 [Dorcoceras hygrometricum]|uniref:Uncharacterized protein n=1 Tax=Dorcoceras hygrometricum TaxID=472368 RepID=A0A2Z7CEM9_9LAMI|nr:hypothetical protein F511_26681 [Dorcoceras hygrometricum]
MIRWGLQVIQLDRVELRLSTGPDTFMLNISRPTPKRSASSSSTTKLNSFKYLHPKVEINNGNFCVPQQLRSRHRFNLDTKAILSLRTKRSRPQQITLSGRSLLEISSCATSVRYLAQLACPESSEHSAPDALFSLQCSIQFTDPPLISQLQTPYSPWWPKFQVSPLELKVWSSPLSSAPHAGPLGSLGLYGASEHDNVDDITPTDGEDV